MYKKISKERFKKEWLSKSLMSEETFDKNFVVLSCKCDAEQCQGWAVIQNTQDAIKTHLELYT
jgi:hypothetical protein